MGVRFNRHRYRKGPVPWAATEKTTVAPEFVVTLAGAAQELDDAVIINPYDVDAFASALTQAIDMPEEEQERRMKTMRKVVAGRNVFNWASDILEGLESLWTKPLHYSVRASGEAPV